MANTSVLGLPMSPVGSPEERYSETASNKNDSAGVGALTPKEVTPMGVSSISGNRSGMDKSDGTGGKCR